MKGTFVLMLAMLLLGGCARRASQSDPPSYRPEGPADLFADGASARPLVTGVVPRPVDRSPGIPYMTVESPGPAHMDIPAAEQTIPFPITAAVLRRGQERFDIYCVMCHGRAGDGDGMVVQRGFSRPPSYYNRKLLDAPDSHFFDVITNGYGAMYSYNDRIAPDDRWAITAYIRSLQAAARQSSATSQPAVSGGSVR